MPTPLSLLASALLALAAPSTPTAPATPAAPSKAKAATPHRGSPRRRSTG